MRVLVIGGGGREHALVAALAASAPTVELVAAPGNAGMAQMAECVPLAATDLDGISRLCHERDIQLVVVGPEDPLALGLADRLVGEGRLVFGPRREAATIEASKAWAKGFMRRHGLPTAAYAQFDDYDEARLYLEQHPDPCVLKADGLAAGKGALVAHELAQALDALRRIMVEREFGAAGAVVVIEEFLTGEELSVLAITDGGSLVMAPPAQDHKRAFDGDEGPNTGGMGAYTPVPAAGPELVDEVRRTVIEPALGGLAREGRPYSGVLYAGLMLTAEGPKVLEFNARFGDPETQVLLPLFAGDFLELVVAAARGRLHQVRPAWSEGAAGCVVMASGGYPGQYEKGRPIRGLAEAAATGVRIYHAGTAQGPEGVVTAGGRVLGVVGTGTDLATALARAYAGVGCIHFEGAHYRRDIGARALGRYFHGHA